ncbi:hypothetical protein SDRG_00690 [Saprolegnia diclina VS20]|uniref:PH domain-containing protein n=1 Tax=Saprolegnia diclina (strain VS20) TaxID=1156394 RepID=T0R4D3_SAPDV|nr:hypothetical protein SDRG_00690 [Saprolegnia diclina VS20]EQC41831.1 hypothetical protein SDRG_00690 [Saprolegnia diclina VS20]|eukprot:XP_008604400.1 hypothetical protein SDRG_00690 [Saprolegnia diclina VS20]
MAEREDENAYEKLSREVHQAQTTGAIHPDWLENPCGFLLKPDFKRKMQHMGAGGKKLQTSIRGLRLHLPGSSYRSRWFVLDGMMLRYFRSKNDEQELGAIHLTSVNAVLPSSMADAPDHALDLVCADRIYTVAAATREDMVRWATVLTLVLRGEYQPKLMQRRESAVIRGSSVIPPHNGRGSAVAVMRQASQVLPAAPTFQPTLTPFDEEPEDKEREMDAKLRAMSVREKMITVTFDTPGPLHLLLQSTMEDTIMVRGFQEPAEGGVGLAEATGIIMLGDILVAIQDHTFSTLPFAQAIEEIQRAARPLTLRFSRLEAAPIKQVSRLAQGWVLAKEPATNRVRIRLLQLQGSKLHLFKSGLHIGRQERPVLTLALDDVTDIRPLHDKRPSVTCVQGFPKTFGLTLEASHFMFTCYVLSLDELKTWLDVLKNAIVFEKPRLGTSTIPVHPIMVLEKAADATMTTVASTLLVSDALKWGELTHEFEARHLVLRSGGKLQIYSDASRTVLLTTLRCDAIVALTPSQVALGGDEAAYQLEIAVVLASNNVHWRRSFNLRFESIHVLMKWARYLEREVRHSAGRELDVTLLETNAESLLLTSSGPRVARYEPQDEYVRWVASSRGCRHFGQLRIEGPMAQGWFYVKKPGAVGADAYHPRFVVLKDHHLLLHKYETASADVCAGRIDLAEIRTVRVVKGDSMDAFDFSIQLKTSSNLVFTLAALTQAQKEAWFMLLLWASDYYFQETPLNSLLPPPKLVSSTSSAEHVTNRLSIEVVQNAALATTSRASLWAVESIAQIRGWLTLGDQRVYAAILNGVLSYYEVEDDLDNEWGDALDAIELSRVLSVSCDGDARFAVVLSLDTATEITVHLEAVNAVWAKKWMLAMCSCSRLVLLQDETKLYSTAPKEGYLWKLDRLYQVHRKRFFCLRNHELVVSTAPDGRVLNVIALDTVAGIFLSKIAGAKDYFQMHLHCVHDADPVLDPTLTATALAESDEDMDSASFQTISVSFFDEAEMREWALAVYHCCTNAMINHSGANLQLPSTIETFPQALMKTTAFLDATTDETDGPSNTGWLFYRSGVNERYRRRFFVLRGFELSIYKHDLGADEIAIRYGVVDVRSVLDVQFVSRNCPENAIELAFSATTLTLIPPSDAAAVAWRSAFLDVKRSVVTNHDVTSGVLISRSSTFALQKENEELLRMQIETLVSFAANLLAYDGSKWVANYYVMTSARLLVFSLAVHLYDEDPDLLSTFETKHIVQVRSLTLDEEAERSGSNSACAFSIHLSTVPDPLVLKCETFDHCLQWMRMLCHSNGKLELKRNAATGVWGSVNRIASLSRHNSFLAAGPPRFSEASSAF